MNKDKNGNKASEGRLANLLRMRPDADDFAFVWQELESRGILEEWETGRTSEKDVVDDAKNILGIYRRALGQRSGLSDSRSATSDAIPTPLDVPVEPTERERETANALRLYFASHATRRPLVQRFRRENLPDGRLLTREEEIAGYLASELEVEPDVDQYLESLGSKEQISIPWRLDAERPIDIELDDPSWKTDDDMAQITSQEEERQEREIERLWEGYTGSHLEMLGGWLAQKYPWKNVGDAAVFLVSGRPPRLSDPLSATVDVATGVYSVSFLPWISEETVTRAYRDLQTFRAPGDKTIRVLRFVSGQVDEEGHRPTWEKLLDRWNAAHPDEKYGDKGALYKAYARAIEALIPPYLPLREGGAWRLR